MKIVGDEKDTNGDFRTETLELWHRDPLECIAELLANPLFEAHQTYQPQRVYRQQKNGVGANREYSEMWTGDWWWETQVSSCSVSKLNNILTEVETGLEGYS